MRFGHLRLLAFCVAVFLLFPPAGVFAARQGSGAVGNMVYVGNVKSGVYHNSGCRHFTCKNCVVRFSSAEEARKKGYRPCKTCGG